MELPGPWGQRLQDLQAPGGLTATSDAPYPGPSQSLFTSVCAKTPPKSTPVRDAPARVLQPLVPGGAVQCPALGPQAAPCPGTSDGRKHLLDSEQWVSMENQSNTLFYESVGPSGSPPRTHQVVSWRTTPPPWDRSQGLTLVPGAQRGGHRAPDHVFSRLPWRWPGRLCDPRDPSPEAWHRSLPNAVRLGRTVGDWGPARSHLSLNAWSARSPFPTFDLIQPRRHAPWLAPRRPLTRLLGAASQSGPPAAGASSQSRCSWPTRPSNRRALRRGCPLSRSAAAHAP